MQATRQRIVDYLHREQRATARELAGVLGLTTTAVRQHLAILERDAVVQARAEGGRVGRPARIFTLTERGEAHFPKGYDVLANMLMDELRAIAGREALQRVLKRISLRLATDHLSRVEGRTMAERVGETAQVLREMGCVADCEPAADGYLIRQFTCPYPNVARRNPAVCALEVDFVRRMTGADARLITSLLRGDRSCTYRVRPVTQPTT